MWIGYSAVCALMFFTWALGVQSTTQEVAAQPTAVQEPVAGKALVYFYRYKELNAAFRSPAVFCDEVELARMQNGRFFVAKIEPGRHTFRSTVKESGVEMDLKAGQQYFLRVEIGGDVGGLGVPARINLVPQEQGPYEVKKLKPIDKKKIVNSQMVIAAEQTAPQ